jgi:hypothetical protein
VRRVTDAYELRHSPSRCGAGITGKEPKAMRKPITTTEALVTRLRAHMPSAVIVNDEFQYLVAEVDPARPHQPLRIITTVSDDETCPARELLDEACNAAVDFDSDTALRLPVRYGPSCSMYTLSDAPYAETILELTHEMFARTVEGEPCPSCGAPFEGNHRCAPGACPDDKIPFS